MRFSDDLSLNSRVRDCDGIKVVFDCEPAGERRLARVYQRHDDSSLAVGFFDSSAYENDIGFGDGYHFVEGCYCKVGPREDTNTLHLHLPDYVIRHCPPFAYPSRTCNLTHSDVAAGYSFLSATATAKSTHPVLSKLTSLVIFTLPSNSDVFIVVCKLRVSKNVIFDQSTSTRQGMSNEDCFGYGSTVLSARV